MSRASSAVAIVPAPETKQILGFWIYIMTDCVLFASLFATYAVLHKNTNGGPSTQQLYDMPYVLMETMLLLTSSFCSGLAILAARRKDINKLTTWLGATFCLGLIFLVMEILEFNKLAVAGHSWHQSGFLSAYYTLVGTHGLHIAAGLIWMVVLGVQIKKRGLTTFISQRLTLFTIFWHFLDLIWIFIFTIVYLFGVIPV